MYLNGAIIAIECELHFWFTHTGSKVQYLALHNVQYEVNDRRADYSIYVKQENFY
jgi:hypothetical protein